ncbi:hypothetical protein QC825_08140 [Larsenimonas suaedae]|uniref:Uncharacterized protein n=1 Tax=Larsenimonas suaedae TaxID=1851019 RepID=A0ABU1GVH6_9GAMM|nr:hypothetical protein [Larsenimonas suaedae]MDR5896036.1 hypothetical protein [Larsenimonas suaedae]
MIGGHNVMLEENRQMNARRQKEAANAPVKPTILGKNSHSIISVSLPNLTLTAH